MVGWHHRLSGCEFEPSLGDSQGQGSLVYCGPWGCKVWHDLETEQEQWAILSSYIQVGTMATEEVVRWINSSLQRAEGKCVRPSKKNSKGLFSTTLLVQLANHRAAFQWGVSEGLSHWARAWSSSWRASSRGEIIWVQGVRGETGMNERNWNWEYFPDACVHFGETDNLIISLLQWKAISNLDW